MPRPPLPSPESARAKQARSGETERRLLDAAESLIQEKGLADASIPEIVRRAGSSVGGFYARFADKDALLRALEDRFFQELAQRLERLADAQRWGDAPLSRIVEACVHELVSVTRARANLMQAFLFRAAQNPEFQADALRFRAQVAGRLTKLVALRGDRIGHPDPGLAVEFGVQLAFGLMFQIVLTGEVRVRGRALSDSELRREIERNFLSYLGVDDAPAPRAPTPRRRR
jgi:AcrR family transcriptional regulator